MRVFIAGMDGYLGWSLALYLLNRKYVVGGCDAFFRRRWVSEIGSQSVTPIPSMLNRIDECKRVFGKAPFFSECDLKEYREVKYTLKLFKPDVVVHLGEMPSAPYSMIDAEHATYTQINNLAGTLNLLFAIKEISTSIHLVKLGTMGEYGTPNLDIPEGFFEISYRGRDDVLPFPRKPPSFYHCSKVHDSVNIQFACETWGLRSTDIMQGVVYGIHLPEMNYNVNLLTRFDIDEVFGTAINRFCAQALVGTPLTLYGKGTQKRGFIPLQDSMQCLQIAIDNPPKQGEYRVFNQFEDVYELNWLANLVKQEGDKLGLDVKIAHLDNPRVEKEEHYYNPVKENLVALGYTPTGDPAQVISEILTFVNKFKHRIIKKKIIPTITWRGKIKRKKKTLREV